MADVVTTQTVIDGDRNTVVKLTNLSDGTGESAVTKVDVSALNGSPSSVKINKIHYAVDGMSVTLFWDATTDVRIAELSGHGTMDFTGFGGLPNNAGAGKTGDIVLTTNGASLNDSYTIILELAK